MTSQGQLYDENGKTECQKAQNMCDVMSGKSFYLVNLLHRRIVFPRSLESFHEVLNFVELKILSWNL